MCGRTHPARPNAVHITYSQSGLQDHIDADAVVCTIPFGVLRQIAVTPEWSPAKRHAIDTLVYGAVVRTTFQVNSRYWQAQA